MAKGQRNYSDQERAEALAVIKANGGDCTKASQELNIPYSTLYLWKNGGSVNEHTLLKAGEYELMLAARTMEIAEKMLGYLNDDDKIKVATLPQISTAYGTLVDKAALLTDVGKVLRLHDEETDLIARSAKTNQGTEPVTETKGNGTA